MGSSNAEKQKNKNKTYDAFVVLDDTGGKYINFKLEFDKKGKS